MDRTEQYVAPGIRAIHDIKGLRDWESQGESSNVSRVPIAPRLPRTADTKPCLVGFDMGEFSYDPMFDAWSQGGFGSSSTRTAANVYNFSNWQYVDYMYYLSGRFFTIPPVVWTNCAHKNGVFCMGTLNLNHNVVSEKDAINMLTPNPQQPEPGALYLEETIDIMTSICKYFGFDGYLINCEDLNDKAAVPGMLKLLSSIQKAGIKSIWYDSPLSAESGGYDYRLTEHAFPFFENASFFQSDYGWGDFDTGEYPKLSYEVLKSHFSGQDLENARNRMFQGIDCSKYRKTAPYGGKFFRNCAQLDAPNPIQFYTGMCIYYPAWLMYDFRKKENDYKLPDRETFHNNDAAFWTGSRDFIGYPAAGKNSVGDHFVAHYLGGPRSTIVHAPFVCWFNDGEGDYYNIDGVLASVGPWNNLSDQSVLPAYRYQRIPDPSDLTGLQHTEQENIYTGGSSLKVDIRDKAVEINLFQTSIKSSSNMSITIVAKESKVSARSLMLGAPERSPTYVGPSASAQLPHGWIKYTFQLPDDSVEYSRIGFSISPVPGEPCSFYLGLFSFDDTNYPVELPNKLVFTTPVDVLDLAPIFKSRSHYRIYGIKNGVRTLIGVAYNSVFRVAFNGKPIFHNLNTEVAGFTSYLVQEVNAAGVAAEI